MKGLTKTSTTSSMIGYCGRRNQAPSAENPELLKGFSVISLEIGQNTAVVLCLLPGIPPFPIVLLVQSASFPLRPF